VPRHTEKNASGAYFYGQLERAAGSRSAWALLVLRSPNISATRSISTYSSSSTNIFPFRASGIGGSLLLGTNAFAVGTSRNPEHRNCELQESSTSTKSRIDHVGAGHLRSRRRIHGPSSAATFGIGTRPPTSALRFVERGIDPAVDPWRDPSRNLRSAHVGRRRSTTHVGRGVKSISATRYKDLQDIIAIRGIEELSDEDKRPCAAAHARSKMLRRRCLGPRSFTEEKASTSVRRHRAQLQGKLWNGRASTTMFGTGSFTGHARGRLSEKDEKIEAERVKR